MLDELRIHGLGVIDEAVLPLGPGLTVVTGETGAGKTMVVTGLLLLFGGRADPARVRTGSSQASVDGRIVVAADSSVARRVRDAGGELDEPRPGDADAIGDTELVLRRVVSAAGRSRAYAGGAAVPATVLVDLAEHLVAVHGQADQLRLIRPGAQRRALDRYADIDLDPHNRAYTEWRDAEHQLTQRSSRAAELRRESELLQHGIAEIEAAGPQPGEAEQLAALAARLGHADALKLAARAAHDALVGDPDVQSGEVADAQSVLGTAARGLAQQHGDDPELDALAARLTEIGSLAADLGSDLGAYADQLDSDPARLEQVESRRAALAGLVRKYCDDPEPSLDAVLRWAATAAERLASIDVSDEALAALRARRDESAATVAALAAGISDRRHEAARRLGADVTTELAGLAMADAELEVRVRPRPLAAGTANLAVNGQQASIGPDGADEVELLLAPHPGAPALPLGRGASGGELSRVMLALEVSLAGTDPVPTLVFDEIDAGVGGRAALQVGRRLARLARDRQVLVVTHLPQVAAFADRHIVVDKPQSAGSAAAVTASDVRLVIDDDRIEELARMLAGSATGTARRHASELLADAAADRLDEPDSAPRRKRAATG